MYSNRNTKLTREVAEIEYFMSSNEGVMIDTFSITDEKVAFHFRCVKYTSHILDSKGLTVLWSFDQRILSHTQRLSQGKT